MDELMRHQPTLKTDAMTAIIKVINTYTANCRFKVPGVCLLGCGGVGEEGGVGVKHRGGA